MRIVHPLRGGAALAAACMLASFAGATAAAETYELKIGFVTVNDSNHFTSMWFKEAIEKRTDGRIKVSIYPAAQLGTIPRQVEGIQLGTQEQFLTPPGFFQGINPAFAACDAPGMFESQWHQHMTMNHPKVFEKFSRLGEKAGFVATYMWNAGEAAVSSRDPIRTLDDFKGKKLRVLATKIEIAVMEEVGAAGVPIPYSQVIPSIQRRVVDGASSAIVVMGPSKFYTVAPYLTKTKSAYVPVGAFTSLVFLNKLPADLRQAVYEEGQKIADRTGEKAIEITRHWERQWAKEGGEVIELSEADRREFARRVFPLGDRILGGDPKVREMYEVIKAAAAETREAAAAKMKTLQ